MKLITNRISTGKAKSFEDFVNSYRSEKQVKTASVKTAEQEEADSSGQLDVEPLHQEGESTTMPKAGPSAKKDDGEKSAAATKKPDAEGEDSGQPKAEGSEKFTNKVKFDPNDSSDEEKGIDAGSKTRVKTAKEEKCDGCGCLKGECTCKDCTADKDKEDEEKTAGKLPDALKEHQFKAKGDSDDDKDEEKEEKEAGSVKFVKIANLDEKNKGFLKEYWRQLFGDDYVNALIADK